MRSVVFRDLAIFFKCWRFQLKDNSYQSTPAEVAPIRVVAAAVALSDGQKFEACHITSRRMRIPGPCIGPWEQPNKGLIWNLSFGNHLSTTLPSPIPFSISTNSQFCPLHDCILLTSLQSPLARSGGVWHHGRYLDGSTISFRIEIRVCNFFTLFNFFYFTCSFSKHVY